MTDPPPLVSCIMPTADRRAFVAQAVAYFRRQTYARRELIVVDDGADPVTDLVPPCDDLRYLRLTGRRSVGAKRNLACEAARGDVIAHWDDDDWHAPHRIERQVAALRHAGASLCGLRSSLYYDPRSGRAWRYTFPADGGAWLSGSTLCYARSWWAARRFEDVDVGEDARFVWGAPAAAMAVLDDATFHVGVIHGRNVAPKRTVGPRWQPHDPAPIEALLGDDLDFYRRAFARTRRG